MAFTNSHQLYACIRDGAYDRAKGLLQSCKDIDILYDDGVSVFYAIKSKNSELLSRMIDYHMKDINPTPEQRSLEECIHVNKLKMVIEDIQEQINIPVEVEKVLEPYLESSGESEDEYQEYDEIETENVSISEDFEFQIQSCQNIDPQKYILEFLQDQDSDREDILLGAQQQDISAF